MSMGRMRLVPVVLILDPPNPLPLIGEPRLVRA